jgi:hypothetical protein
MFLPATTVPGLADGFVKAIRMLPRTADCRARFAPLRGFPKVLSLRDGIACLEYVLEPIIVSLHALKQCLPGGFSHTELQTIQMILANSVGLFQGSLEVDFKL